MKFGRTDYDKRIVDLENRIPIDEPVFFLRGNDQFAPRLLLMWATELRLAGGDPAMAKSAEDHAQSMIEWQRVHGVKTPDMFKDSEDKRYIKESIDNLLGEGKLDIKKLVSLMSDYMDDDGNNYISILMNQDLHTSSKFKDITELCLDDFNLNYPDTRKIIQDKIVVYVTNTGYKVLKYAL